MILRKLTNWPEGYQVLVHCHPKHGQATEVSDFPLPCLLETQADAKVVHDADIRVARSQLELSFIVSPGCLENGSRYNEDRLDLHIFCYQLCSIYHSRNTPRLRFSNVQGSLGSIGLKNTFTGNVCGIGGRPLKRRSSSLSPPR